MMDWLGLSISTGFMPHGHCYLWQPGLLWLHVGADSLIALAYFSIPVTLTLFTIKRRIRFNWIVLMFAGFILFCGLTHLTEAITTWSPIYFTQGGVKVATAAISLATAGALWYLMPRALAIPTADEMQVVNRELERQVEERRQAEARLAQANRELERRVRERTEELTQFVYAISHDLQEPLRHLKTYSEFLEEDLGEDIPERAAQDLRYIAQAGRRLDDMVSGIQALSRVGKQEMKTRTIDVGESIRDALDNLEEKIAQTGACIGPIPSRSVVADSRMLLSVYQNLIDNALKYADGRPEIEFTVEEGEDELVLGVRDQGIGIEPEYRERIMQPFTRLHSPDEGAGSGIGLSICRRAIDRHGGRIWIEADGEQGVHFRFTIPRRGRPS